jgi:hypothetical protein
VGKAKRAHLKCLRMDDGGHGAKGAFAHPTSLRFEINAPM